MLQSNVPVAFLRVITVDLLCTKLYLSGINEADGHERMATLDVLVLQVFCLHADFGGNYDVFVPRQTRRLSSDHYLYRSYSHIRVFAAVCTFSYDLLLRHLHVLFER